MYYYQFKLFKTEVKEIRILSIRLLATTRYAILHLDLIHSITWTIYDIVSTIGNAIFFSCSYRLHLVLRFIHNQNG